MYGEDSTVQLISSESLTKRKGRRSRGQSRENEQMILMSDSEKGAESELEETTVFSDTLPSMRAQLAATQMQNKKRRKDNFDSPSREGNSLLASHESKDSGSITTVLESSIKKESAHGQYGSLGGKILPKKEKILKNV